MGKLKLILKYMLKQLSVHEDIGVLFTANNREYFDILIFPKFSFDSWSLPSTTCYQIHLLPFNIGKYWEHSENIIFTIHIILCLNIVTLCQWGGESTVAVKINYLLWCPKKEKNFVSAVQTGTMYCYHPIVGPMVGNHRKPSLPMVDCLKNH